MPTCEHIIVKPFGDAPYPRAGGSYGPTLPYPFTYPTSGANLYITEFNGYFYAWTPVSDQSWLQIGGGSGRSADGYLPNPETGQYVTDPRNFVTPAPYHEGVYFHLDANTTPCRRVAHVRIIAPSKPGLVAILFEVRQEGIPTYLWDPPSVTVSAEAHGVSSPLYIDNTQGAAGWYFYSPTPWISFDQGSVSSRHIVQPYFGTTPEGNILTSGGGYYAANPGPTARTGIIEVHDFVYDSTPTLPPSTPSLATLYVNQLPPGVIDPVLPPVDPGINPPGVTVYGNCFNLSEPSGYYCRCASGADGNVWFWRVNNNAPWSPHAWDWGPLPAARGTANDSARMAYDRETRRLYLVYSRISITPSVYESRSDNDGETWGQEHMAIPGGTHPTIAVGLDNTRIIASYVGAIGGPGRIDAVVQGPGDVAFSAVFTLKDQNNKALIAGDDSFHLTMPPAGDRQWILVFVVNGEAGPSEWVSGEPEGRTWTRVL